MFRNAGAALDYILSDENILNDDTKQNYYVAFAQLSHEASPGQAYYDLFELNEDDTRLLENRNALTAYCNFIMHGTPVALRKQSFRFGMISSLIRHFGVQYEQGRLFTLPTRAWGVSTITLSEIVRRQPHQPSGVTLFSTGHVATVNDLKYTIFDDQKVVYRSALELSELCALTGVSNPAGLVCYRPSMIAFHTAMAAVAMTIQLKPFDSSEPVALDHSNYLRATVGFVISEMGNDIALNVAELEKKRLAIQQEVVAIVDGKAAGSEGYVNLISMHRAKLGAATVNVGVFKKGYTKRDALIALVTDAIYTQCAEQVFQEMVQVTIDRLVREGLLNRLQIPPPEERVTFMISGGPASGKGSSAHDIRQLADERCGGWSNVFKFATDAMKDIVHEYIGAPITGLRRELFSQLVQTQARFINQTLVFEQQLMKLAAEGRAPHVFVDQCKIYQNKVDTGLASGGSVYITVVSADESDCVERSFQRGTHSGRYENVKGLLDLHKFITEDLPVRIKHNAGKQVFIKIVDNNVAYGEHPEQVAEIDCLNKTIIIHDEQKMLRYLRKLAINIDARSPEQLHDPVKLASISITDYFKSLDSYDIEIRNVAAHTLSLPGR